MNLTGLMALPASGLALFLLILVRASAIFLIAPMLGHTQVPARFKIGLAFFIALILTPLLLRDWPPLTLENPWLLAAALFQEMVLGVLIGFLVQLVFVAFQFAGQVVGQQMGFGMANIMDPQTATQVSVIAQIYMIAGSLIYLTLDGHLWMLMALEKSLRIIPPGQYRFDGVTMSLLLDATNDLFWITVLLAAPVMGVLVLTELGMGIVARIMPQMNIFVASFPIKIGLGVLTLAVSLPILIEHMAGLFEQNFAGLLTFLRAVSAGVTNGGG